MDPKDFSIVHALDLKAELSRLHKEGLPKGDSTGWKSLDEYYTVLPGQVTLITGVPSHGKTSFLDALMVNLAKQGWVFSVFSPEQQPTELHLVSLMEKFVGKRFDHRFHGSMSNEDIDDAMNFIDIHFDIVKSNRFDKMPDMDEILQMMEICLNARKSFGQVGPFGVVIDPWNELDNRDLHDSETERVRLALSMFRYFCREAQFHGFIVAHPKQLVRNKDGAYPKPRPYDISGSAHWYNKPDNILTVWRDTTNGGPTEIHIDKVKFKNVGKQGMVSLEYVYATGQYLDMDQTCYQSYTQF